ncbi:MAG: 50S ribosomal protein L24 [Pirellula sp.]|jgi:large subunit ribosomal protein L24|nr:50S ribosomal protein L24 [Pirellula sp.]
MLIKVNDTVVVLSGRDKGQTGKVIKVDRANNKLIVEGLNKIFKHVKKSQRNPQGGRLSKESFIDASKVMLVCPKTGKPTRLGVRVLPDGSKERYSKKSGETISVVSPPKGK